MSQSGPPVSSVWQRKDRGPSRRTRHTKQNAFLALKNVADLDRVIGLALIHSGIGKLVSLLQSRQHAIITTDISVRILNIRKIVADANTVPLSDRAGPCMAHQCKYNNLMCQASATCASTS